MNENKLVSYCILCYNQEKYIKSCLESVLSQTYKNLEIIISDDNSSDDTWIIIQDTLRRYKGNHTIKSFKNKENLGLALHYSKVAYEIALGEHIVFIGGDDISRSEHVATAMGYVNNFPDIMLFDFNGEIIDENDLFVKKIDIKHKFKRYNLSDYVGMKVVDSLASGRVFNRKLIDIFPPINANCPTEDSVMVLRGLLTGGFLRVDENLIKYRKHSNNMSSTTGLAKMSNLAIISQYIKDMLYLFDNNIIDESVSVLLLERINLEHKLRVLKYSKRNFKTQYVLRPLLIRLHQLYFKLKMNSKINKLNL
jgi:glycosyltransferase involved in cell wall biosynthesis